MKSKEKATRHSQFDDWIVFPFVPPTLKVRLARSIFFPDVDARSPRVIRIWKAIIFGKTVNGEEHATGMKKAILFWRIPWRSVLRAKVIKMAVIWLATFHSQFDLSDRKRFLNFRFALSTFFYPPIVAPSSSSSSSSSLDFFDLAYSIIRSSSFLSYLLSFFLPLFLILWNNTLVASTFSPPHTQIHTRVHTFSFFLSLSLIRILIRSFVFTLALLSLTQPHALV